MAYDPISWDELTPIIPANLNKMDDQIDDNDARLNLIDSDNDGKVDAAELADFATNSDKVDNYHIQKNGTDGAGIINFKT